MTDRQTVLVTGASRGIGRAIAERFLADGARVAAVARNAEQLADLAEGQEPDGVLALEADVTDPGAMRAVHDRILDRWGPPHLVVANAGRLDPIGPLWESDPGAWWRDVEVNLRGSFLTVHGLLPAMIEAGRGRIVLFGGGGSTRALPWVSAYAMSKAAILRLAETLDQELEGTGLHAFSVSPGFVRTDMTERFAATGAGRRYVGQLAARLDRNESTPPEACAELLVRIGRGELDPLHGRFVHAAVDLEHLDELVAAADRIEREEERVLGLKGFSL